MRNLLFFDLLSTNWYRNSWYLIGALKQLVFILTLKKWCFANIIVYIIITTVCVNAQRRSSNSLCADDQTTFDR